MSAYSIRPYFDFARMKLSGHTAHTDFKGTMIYMEPDRRSRPRCHVCGRPGSIHTSGLHRAVRPQPRSPDEKPRFQSPNEPGTRHCSLTHALVASGWQDS